MIAIIAILIALLYPHCSRRSRRRPHAQCVATRADRTAVHSYIAHGALPGEIYSRLQRQRRRRLVLNTTAFRMVLGFIERRRSPRNAQLASRRATALADLDQQQRWPANTWC
ncbi:MAG: hypothetical protein U0835_04580 [Isosphaeraceae bacterium]